MKVRCLTAAILTSAALSQAFAQGCGPTRLKASESVLLSAPPQEAWAIVGDFQDASWDATTISTKGSGANEPGRATRTLTLRSGAVFDESLYKYDAGAMKYAFHIDKIDVKALPVQNVSATIEVLPMDGGRSQVRWKAVFYRYLRPGEPAPDVADREATDAMSAFLRQGLAGLKTKPDART